ncbi:MAG: ComEC/Rec2 family competence protein, partial [Ruminococcus sp.]|nr:ComEC/Rec2 family competence protein [Ruminococcus sp.]
IELPNGKTMLIDSGENYHGAAILSYIKDRGYDKIDYVVGTHPHSDHIGSMAYIVRNIKIGSVYMPKVATNTVMYEKLLEAVEKKNRKIQNGRAGITIARDKDRDFAARIIAPLEVDEKNLNNSSVMILLDYKDATFLFTGDAEKDELNTIKADVTADVLKVGHHGSRNANPKDFLEKVDPQIAVISCGVDNDYGHPHKETLKILSEMDCDVYRTDKDQTVTVYTDGEKLGVETGGEVIERAK